MMVDQRAKNLMEALDTVLINRITAKEQGFITDAFDWSVRYYRGTLADLGYSECANCGFWLPTQDLDSAILCVPCRNDESE